MLKKTLIWVGVLVVAIVLISLMNPFMVYHVSRYDPVNFGEYFEYSGVIGIRTSASDGIESYASVGRFCDSLNLHFAITTDDSPPNPANPEYWERSGMTLMIPGVEISGGPNEGSYVAVGDSLPMLPSGRAGVDSVLLHPARKGLLVIRNNPPHRVGRFDSHGIVIYSFERNLRGMLGFAQFNKLLGAYLDCGVDPHAMNYLIEYPKRELDLFDKVSGAGRMFFIGESGARGYSIFRPGLRVDWPSYLSSFDMVHTVILTQTPYNVDYRHDTRVTLDAIAKGHAYVAFPGLESARGFFFTAISGSDSVIMGDSLLWEGGATVNIILPDSNHVETRLIRNGKMLRAWTDKGAVTLNLQEPGVYRVEVFQKRSVLPFFLERKYPWILSNPIYIYK